MKTILLLLFTICISYSQGITFGKKEYSNISTSIVPYSIIKSENINITFEFEYVPYWFYIKPSIKIMTAPNTTYVNLGAGLGLNLNIGQYENLRVYGGFRLGFINRNSKGYPLFGYEIGVDKKITDKFYIGSRFTLDNREDAIFTNDNPFYQFNPSLRFTYNLKD